MSLRTAPDNGRGGCLPGVGRFLAVLAAGCVGGRIGELLACAARELLAADSRVEVITGDAFRVIPSRGPFDLLFADSGVRDPADFAVLVSWTEVVRPDLCNSLLVGTRKT